MSELLERARKQEAETMEKVPEGTRPMFHFSNPAGWMNDPNGFSEYQGEHHLFFQYNPYATYWNRLHWGHAKSKDFIRWEYLPAALAPDRSYDGFGVFSGGAVEADGKQVLLYTGVEERQLEDGRKIVLQNQCLAVGNGVDYEKHLANPVITSEILSEGSSREDFRDPKLWREDGRYYTVVGSRSEDGSGQIALLYSDDLEHWQLGSILDRSRNKLGRMWECPDFFPLGEKQVLLISPQEMEAEGLEFHNGNNTAFLTGEYEKVTMQFQREAVQSADYGLDFYAPQTMQTEDGRRVLIAWMQSWDNPMYPDHQLWSGMMTVPRELSLRNGRVCQNPVQELLHYRKDGVSYHEVPIGKETALKRVEGRTIDLTLTLKGTEYRKCRIRLASDGKRYSEICYNREEGILTFDRTYAGFTRDTISTRSMYVSAPEDVLKLRILIDRYSVEIFANDGEQAMTSLIYTPQEAAGVTFESDGTAVLDVEKYEIVVA